MGGTLFFLIGDVSRLIHVHKFRLSRGGDTNFSTWTAMQLEIVLKSRRLVIFVSLAFAFDATAASPWSLEREGSKGFQANQIHDIMSLYSTCRC